MWLGVGAADCIYVFPTRLVVGGRWTKNHLDEIAVKQDLACSALWLGQRNAISRESLFSEASHYRKESALGSLFGTQHLHRVDAHRVKDSGQRCQ